MTILPEEETPMQTAHSLDIRHDPQSRKYYAIVDGQEAVLQYSEAGPQTLNYWRTFVPVPLRGKGIADEIVRHALEDALEKGLKIVPSCWFVDVYIQRHTRFQGLVASR
jgi:hypothetical protein